MATAVSQTNQQQQSFVIGIDLGTTYSGVAWALESEPNAIEVLTDWPSSGQQIGVKVPTEIAYSVDGPSYSWGYDIDPRHRKIKWFKLCIEYNDDKDHNAEPQLLHGRDAVLVARDYLTALLSHVRIVLTRRYSKAIIDHAQFHYTLTVPAIWSDIAKQRTQDAAIQAGIGSSANPVTLLSEPESAARYSLKTMDTVLESIKIGDRIVVCDAGGGTVDLISYHLKSREPRLEITECTMGAGDFCGSSFVDLEFKSFFQAKLGSELYGKISVPHIQQIIKDFEGCKMAFRDETSSKIYTLRMPNSVPDDPTKGIKSGTLELSTQDMLTIFDPVVAKVIRLIDAQVKLAMGQGKVNMVLLVGGFGQSHYLYHRVQTWAKAFNIQVIQAKDSSTAVVRGAVMHGLEQRQVGSATKIMRRARRSYGVPTKTKFLLGIHAEEDAEIDPMTGELLAANQVRWFIFANQLIDDDVPFRYTFRRVFETLTVWADTLVSSPLESPPPRMTADVKLHCTIYSDLTRLRREDFIVLPQGRKVFYAAEYEIALNLKNASLVIELLYRGQRYGTETVFLDEERA